jgi:hypothetical protein
LVIAEDIVIIQPTEFALSDFYVTRIADHQSSIMGWGISLLGSKIDRREEAKEAQRGVWIRYNRE